MTVLLLLFMHFLFINQVIPNQRLSHSTHLFRRVISSCEASKTAMSAHLKPIKLWGRAGLNPSKIRIILEELGLRYDAVSVPLKTVKETGYLAVNPNGRLPTIYDPNTDTTLWESGAIAEYLIETYDKNNLLGFASGTKEYFHAKQWLFFQVSIAVY
jgi:hypothetical protein